ncbi:MAG TPA: hypothetical protein DCW55_01040 [Candidatus Pacebacteria bacterium]|nr:hypothetical protein [Candidatus Paceibacterota bacterium]
MKLLTSCIAFVVLCSVSFVTPATISAQTKLDEWNASKGCVQQVTMDLGNGPATYEIPTLSGLECVVRNVLNIAVTAVGLSSFVMLIVGAFTFLLSGGNPKMTEAGKKTLSFALLGILVAISSWLIMLFLSNFTGVTSIMQFTIYQP